MRGIPAVLIADRLSIHLNDHPVTLDVSINRGVIVPKGPPRHSERDTEIYRLCCNGKAPGILAQQFGLSEGRIREIVRRVRWMLNPEEVTTKRSRHHETVQERRQRLGYGTPSGADRGPSKNS